MYSNFLRHPSAPPGGAAARTLKTTELGESANVNLIMKTQPNALEITEANFSKTTFLLEQLLQKKIS